MKSYRLILLTLLTVLVVSGIVLAQTPPASTGSFDGCRTRGVGGDPQLNIKKNRSAASQELLTVTVAQLRTFPIVPARYGKKRGDWPTSRLNPILARESSGAMFIGYIIHAKPEDPESSNCQLAEARDHDVHVYVGDGVDDDASTSAIVEVTPRWRDTNATWTAAALQRLANAGAHVRISGLLLYDQEHWDMISKQQRSTLWELHPITNIEVETDGGWTELAAYEKEAAAQGLIATAGHRLVNARTAAETARATKGAERLP